MMPSIFKTLGKSMEKLTKYVIKHEAAIFTGVAIGGFTLSTIEACRKTPDAIETYDEAIKSGCTKPKAVLKASKHYIFPAIIHIGATASCVKSYRVSSKRIKQLTTACSAIPYLTSKVEEYRVYQEKAKEKLGANKESEIKQAVTKKAIESEDIPKNTEQTLKSFKPGRQLMKDLMTNRLFYATVSDIEKAVNAVNRKMLESPFDSTAVLNDYYEALANEDLEPNIVGDSLGWNRDDGAVEFKAVPIILSDDRVCYGVDFTLRPVANFKTLY